MIPGLIKPLIPSVFRDFLYLLTYCSISWFTIPITGLHINVQSSFVCLASSPRSSALRSVYIEIPSQEQLPFCNKLFQVDWRGDRWAYYARSFSMQFSDKELHELGTTGKGLIQDNDGHNWNAMQWNVTRGLIYPQVKLNDHLGQSIPILWSCNLKTVLYKSGCCLVKYRKWCTF